MQNRYAKHLERRKSSSRSAKKRKKATTVDTTKQFEGVLIERARRGDAEAGREVLWSIAQAIDVGRFDSPLFPFLADCIMQFVQDGIKLERALCIEPDPNMGGAPPYNKLELAAVYTLLRHHAGIEKDVAIFAWIKENIGASASTVRRALKEYSQMKLLPLSDLLHNSGGMRSKVTNLLPQ